MTDEENWNRRRQAAESVDDVREVMGEILTPPGDGEDEEAKRQAAKALEGLEHAEAALREWRDRDEEPVERLDEE